MNNFIRLLDTLRSFWLNRRREVDKTFKRTLPFADYIVDRWEKAKELGFGDEACIYDSSLVIGDVKVGKKTWIGPSTVLDGSGGLVIGSYCSISSGVQIYSHDTVKWAVTGGKAPYEYAKTCIGDNCFIGPNTIIAKGVTIGKGCIIGAQSLVLDDIPAGSKAYGAPCRVRGKVECAAGPVRVVFVGASRFGLRCLERVRHLDNFEVVGVVTNEERFTISYAPEGVKNVLYADFREYSDAHKIPHYVMQGKMTAPDVVDKIKSWKPDLLIVVGWYHMVPRLLRDMCPVVGLHGSLLPDYSGGAPLVWAMINGETKTGITFFQFSDGVDNGPIIGQASTDILPEDTIATLYSRIEGLGLELLEKNLPLFAAGSAVLASQDDSKRRIFSQRKPEDGRITWDQPARKIYDFIRAQTHPYPGAFTTYKNKTVHIWASKIFLSDPGLVKTPGSFYKASDGRILVHCGMNSVLELEAMGADGRELPAHEWFSGCVSGCGDIFV